MRKYNGVYYLVYTDTSRGKATSIAYATSKSPLGPFTKGSIIIDNDGCDRATWNNHGSIAEFNGDWYIFYHRSSQNSKFNRRVCVERIRFEADGSIQEVEMTTQGISGPLDATRRIDAYRACLLSGSVRTESVGPSMEKNNWSEHLTRIENGDWAAYKYIDFKDGVTSFEARVGSLTYGGRIEVRLDSPEGPLLGVCHVPRTGAWQKWESITCETIKISGVHAVYLSFKGCSGRLMDLESFSFSR